jgi:hypothetical protein
MPLPDYVLLVTIPLIEPPGCDRTHPWPDSTRNIHALTRYAISLFQSLRAAPPADLIPCSPACRRIERVV